MGYLTVIFAWLGTFDFKNTHSSENDRQVSHGLWRSRSTHAIILIPAWRRAQTGGSYSMLKIRPSCPPRKFEIFGSVVRFALCTSCRHKIFTMCQAMYEDQENINMLGSYRSSRWASAFCRSLGYFVSINRQSLGYFFPYPCILHMIASPTNDGAQAEVLRSDLPTPLSSVKDLSYVGSRKKTAHPPRRIAT